MEASVLDLRRKMSDIMSDIGRHEHVILTYRGRRRAVIIPLEEEKQCQIRTADLPAFGLWADRDEMADPVKYVEEIRKPRCH